MNTCSGSAATLNSGDELVNTATPGVGKNGPVSRAPSLAAAVLYDVVLAPFVVPLVSGAARRAEPVVSY